MLASPRRLSLPLLTCLSLVLAVVATGPAQAAQAAADPTTIAINEVRSNPGVDFVELVNTGTEPVDITGWKAVDSGATQAPVVITTGATTIAPGGFYSFEPDVITGGFGLGAADSITILLPDGTTKVATYAWTAHRTPSFGRCPGGADLVVNATATKGAANDCPAPDPTKVRINEVRSNPGVDFVELLNTSTQPIDITGWKAVDSGVGQAEVDIAPTATSIAPGGFYTFEPDTITGGFGLGTADSITIFKADGTTAIDTYSWTAHRTPSFGRCPAGTGEFVANVVATKGAKNSCPVPAGGENVKINEVESDPGDRIELINTGGAAVDLSGYVLRDESDASLFTIPAGTTIGAGAVKAFDVNAAYGLGKGDSARLFAPGGETLLDSTTWPVDTHATTWGRCPDGSGTFGVTVPTIGLPNQCAAPADPRTVVKINEVESNGDKVADWVELTNTGTSTVDVSGWKILDNDPLHVSTPVVVPAGTTIAPGAFHAIYTEVNQTPGFGLGGADSATLYLPDGTTVVDTYAWTVHAATTYGRCPDGTGAFTTTTTSTRGASNACSPVRLNEIESDAGTAPDWVELTNISDAAVDISGWSLKDNGDAGAYTFPAGTTVPAKGYRVVEAGAAGFGFSLDPGDSVRLLGATGAVVEQYTWTNPAAVTYGRCKDGLGDFVDTTAATKGSANACPGLDTEPWPGSQDVRAADLTETFVQDLSGLAFDPKDPDVLWAAQNKLGTLFKLVRGANGTWVPDTTNGWGAGKTPKYTDGTGAPDTEGITVGPDGFLYAASERNNSASGVSRMSILRYAPGTADTTLDATDEWNLTGQIPAAGANLGLEGVTWIPDTFLVANGFVDQSTGAAYKPADYPLHGTGLYVVAVEDTGALHAFALDSTGGTSHKVATIASGFAHLADVTFDPERQRLWAVTDDTHDGKTSLLKIQGGAFVVSEAYDRPVTMPNLNNEGFAIAPRSTCVDGFKEVVWSDDGDTGGHSLRSGTITCTVPTTQTVKITSNAPGNPVVGQTYAVTATGGASGNPVVLAAGPASVCTLAGSTVTLSHVGTCTVTADQAGSQGFAAGTTSQVLTVGRASTSTSVAVTPSTVTATVTAVEPGRGSPSGTVELRQGSTVVGTAPLSGGTATFTATVPAGSDATLVAAYSGSDDFSASEGTKTRRDPVITAAVTGDLNTRGWYTAPVTVTFTCAPQGAPLVGDCPAPVTLADDGAGQSVTRTVSAADGGQGTVTVSGLGIDRGAPAVSVGGVTSGKLYVGGRPSARCVATDAVSGVASCTLAKKVTAKRTTLVATATDRAGNTSTTSVTYRTLAVEVRGATYRGGKFTMKRGRGYTLAATVRASGRLYGPARTGAKATATKRLSSNGSARVTIPRSAKVGSTWKIVVKQGSKAYTVKVKVAR